ncbi:alkene reductase [Pseudomonas sp. TE3610]
MSNQPLFTPTQVGPFTLSHRVVMAPLTRMRSSEGNVPNELMAEYYAQRATQGGLIIAEATPVSPYGFGYAGSPGIFTQAQVDGWRTVVDAVHEKGGLIFLQLWHVGRQSHPLLQPCNIDPVAPSAIKADGDAYAKTGPVAFAMPRALALAEIPDIIESFRRGAELAKEAGFDGVEVHGANGYLPDQFLQDGTNRRTDAYGGPIEHRARFLLEITQAVISVWGQGRVGVRLSPSSSYGSMHDSNPKATFGYVATQLDTMGLAYLHVVEPRIKGNETIDEGAKPVAVQYLRTLFNGPIIAAGGFQRESAVALVSEGSADMVAFGRAFIANPDLARRLHDDLPLHTYDRDTFYGGDAAGYTDYPFVGEPVATT